MSLKLATWVHIKRTKSGQIGRIDDFKNGDQRMSTLKKLNKFEESTNKNDDVNRGVNSGVGLLKKIRQIGTFIHENDDINIKMAPNMSPLKQLDNLTEKRK